ncbi:unnamed protein product [Gongylonema pulchrum]|uniref:MARVEL domain-containing protein n=1 Tax=Gongylonema pulchrum TaxID=637853 RepID=A0A183E1A0_9BILA|nr:unnamed protein product [Gongylonema pulchrum]
MLKAEDLEQHSDPVPAVEGTVVESTVMGTADQDRMGPQSPPSFSTPAQSSPKQQQQQQQKRRLKFDMSSKIQIIPDNRQGQLNTAFLATVPGVLKIAEIALSFVSFILAICADRNATTAAWTENISFAAAVIISGLLIGYVCFPHLTIKDEQTREGLIVTELIFYGTATLLFFIAIWLMVHLSASWLTYGRGSAIIDAILCVALTILFGIETFAKLKAWRGENEPSSRIIQTARPMMEPGRQYETNAELRRTQGPEMA